MPESRDRLSRQASEAMGGTQGTMEMAALPGNVVGRGNLGTPRNRHRRGRNLHRSPAAGRENMPQGSVRRGRRRSTNSVLPSWYPRTPLRDITAVVRAFERTRTRLREREGQQIEGPTAQDLDVPAPSEPISGPQLEEGVSIISPGPTEGARPFSPSIGKVPKILLDITNQKAEESHCVTPQRKLLNSIETVEKEVMQELMKLKNTPRAKKAERQSKIRTLMSMR
ncbi:protein POLYCHOME-like [Diospyros lotus]|uniref:protein POLYCHOME-like n=1 Tax=Diospyros lotus TaxID=55363 RepID=UPI002252FBAC|nr:protein POLYCHOME-like [Diospyros lotus]